MGTPESPSPEHRFSSPQKAERGDVAAIAQLTRQFPNEVIPRAEEELLQGNLFQHFIIIRDVNRGEIVACGSLEPYEMPDATQDIPGIAEIRSLSVLLQKKGLGQNIVAALLQEAGAAGYGQVIATTNTNGFFEKFGMEKQRGYIVWMNMENSLLEDDALPTGEDIVKASEEDIPWLMKKIEDDPNLEKLSEKEIRYRIAHGQSFLLYTVNNQPVGCMGVIIYPHHTPGENPRIAEIRSLSFEEGYGGNGRELALFERALRKLKEEKVKQAYAHVTESQWNVFIESTYFNFDTTGKHVYFKYSSSRAPAESHHPLTGK